MSKRVTIVGTNETIPNSKLSEILNSNGTAIMNTNMNMKHGAMIKSTVVKCIMLACFIHIIQAQAQEESATNPLLIPQDLTIKQSGEFQFEELRIGGRLERLTVRHKNRMTEIYQNQRDDSIWFSEENELGEAQNVRQWKLGGW